MQEKPKSDLVVIVGQGYVGLPLAMAAVRAGFRVLGVDLDEPRVNQINRGESPIADVKPEEIGFAIEAGLYAIASGYTDCVDFSYALITVPTPLAAGKPDLSFIESAAESLAPAISVGSTIILESTTYPGTTEELLIPILERGSKLRAGADFHVGYSPERIDPGNQQWGLINTPKVVSGIDAKSLAAVDGFYSNIGITTVPVSGTREAELTKLLENTFRHVNIALVNELAMFSSSLGVNIWEAIEAAGTKPFGFMKFLPGPGVGGHCLPVDPSYLSWAIEEKTGRNFRFVELANTVNSFMPSFVVSRALTLLRENKTSLKSSSVLLAGLSYKPDTSDTRESPSLAVAELLVAEGVKVFAVDSHVPDFAWPHNVIRVNLETEKEFDLGLLLTNHSEFLKSNPFGRCKKILDTRRVIFGSNVEYL